MLVYMLVTMVILFITCVNKIIFKQKFSNNFTSFILFSVQDLCIVIYICVKLQNMKFAEAKCECV